MAPKKTKAAAEIKEEEDEEETSGSGALVSESGEEGEEEEEEEEPAQLPAPDDGEGSDFEELQARRSSCLRYGCSPHAARVPGSG